MSYPEARQFPSARILSEYNAITRTGVVYSPEGESRARVRIDDVDFEDFHASANAIREMVEAGYKAGVAAVMQHIDDFRARP